MPYDSSMAEEDEAHDADSDHYYSYYEDMLLTEVVESSAANVEHVPAKVVTPLPTEYMPYFRENIMAFSLRTANVLIDDMIIELAVEELASEQALVVQDTQPVPEPEPEPEPEPFDSVVALNGLYCCLIMIAADKSASAAASSHAHTRAQGRPTAQGKEAFGSMTSR